MDIVVENLTDIRRKVTVTLPGEEVQPRLNQAYNKLNKTVTLKGFRRGKVPRTVLEKSFKERVQGEVAEKLVQETYFDAIAREGVDAVVHPDIVSHDFNADGTMTYVAEVDTAPVFELKEYKGITLEKPDTEVSDIELDREIQRLRKQHAALRSAEDAHPIAKDDVALIDFQGFHNGKAMKEVRNNDLSLDVGAGNLGDEFEEKLIGMKKSEKALHEITFPPKYPNPVLAGKTIEFKIDIKDVKVRVYPELDDEFAKDINEEYQTIDDLKKGLREQLSKIKEARAQGDLHDQLMASLIDNNPFEVPEKLVRYEMEQFVSQYEGQLQQQGLTLEAMGTNRNQLAENHREAAIKQVRGDFIIKEIGTRENIEVSNEDIERGYQRIAGQYNMTVAEVKKYFVRREETLPLIKELLSEKVLDFLYKEANMVDAAPEENTAQQAEGSETD